MTSSSPDGVVHLHNHTEFSILDGASKIDQLVAAAVADGQTALGVTDHGNMYGVIEFYRACRAQGINPIIGTEAYMAGEHRDERPVRKADSKDDDTGGDADGGGKLNYHITLLAENNVGYKNLIQISSRAFMEGYYRNPRADWEILADHAQGVIATTGCLGGVVLQDLLNGDQAGALQKAGRLQDIFGRDNLFVELQDHGIPAQAETNPQLIDIARKLGAPLLATNDSHYCSPEDHVTHDALLCVQTKTVLSDPDRFRFHGDQHYLKTAREMRHLFAELPEACDNSLLIAQRCDVEIEFGKPQLPDFDLPAGFADDDAYLEHLTLEGARKRWGAKLTDAITDRIVFELRTIKDMGFSSYFLITWDLIRHARERGIRVGPGRGSAAGCAVAYSLDIVDIDPIKYDLLFERFLNPSRVSMPDVDLDFDSRYRDEMIRYAAEKYGREHVAQIITFSQIKSRAAVRDSARVLGYEYAVGDAIAKALPKLHMGEDTPLDACLVEDDAYTHGFREAGELRAMYDGDPDAKTVIDVARGLEGLRRSDGIHAAAVVITKNPLTDYLPIQRKPEAGKPIEDAPVVTQYGMHDVEALGLLKMDFLGLRNLDVIQDTVDMIERVHGVTVDIDDPPLDDETTLTMLARGDSIGVFQLEGVEMRALMRALAPTCFDDIAALTALYRPGPMAANMHYDYADRANGRQEVSFLHPDAEDILGPTQGLMIYQESMMRIAQRFAGYSLADADILRKACFPAGTKLMSWRRGEVPIEKLMGLTDRRVLSIDPCNGVSRHEEVDDVWSVGVKPVFKLATRSGYVVEATANHPFYVGDEWVELSEIRPGDAIAVAPNVSTQGGSRISDAEIDLSALLISEGFMPVGRSGHFTNADIGLVDFFADAYRDHFGRTHTSTTMCGDVHQMRVTRAELDDLSGVIGARGLSGDRTIPNCVMNASQRKIERFVALYLCCDGWSDKSGLHFGSKSYDVVASLKKLVARCGVASSIGSRFIEDYGIHWTLDVVDSDRAKKLAGIVGPHMTNQHLSKMVDDMESWAENSSAGMFGIPCDLVKAEIGRRSKATGRSRHALGETSGPQLAGKFIHPVNVRHLAQSERLYDLSVGDMIWDQVESVEYVGDKECFDFQMANGDRPFAVVEGFIAHNCGKKDKAMLAEERTKFVAGCVDQGYTEELGTQWFDIIEPFADYAFNKSHSVGYGFVAYQTAYLKANHPVEYLAALLSSVKSSLDKAAVYLAECRSLGIRVLTPDVNVSVDDFTSTFDADTGDGAIAFGLSAVANVGAGPVASIVGEREANGAYVDFYDFCQRVDGQVLNRRTMESLIKAGAFDSLGHPRMGLVAVFEQIVESTVKARKAIADGALKADDVDDADGVVVDVRPRIPDVEFERGQRLMFEKAMLGLYVSDHPLHGMSEALARKVDVAVADVGDCCDGKKVVVGGVVTELRRKWTRRNEMMAVFVLDDLGGAIEVVVFPRDMKRVGRVLAEDMVVTVTGRVDKRDAQAKLVASAVERFVPVDDGAPPVRIQMAAGDVDAVALEALSTVLAAHPGGSPVFLHLGESKVLRLPEGLSVQASDDFADGVRSAVGAGVSVL